MTNGTAVIIREKTFKVGTQATIAGKSYKVYNTMPGLQLVGFTRVSKAGKILKEKMSLSFDQIASFLKLNIVVA